MNTDADEKVSTTSLPSTYMTADHEGNADAEKISTTSVPSAYTAAHDAEKSARHLCHQQSLMAHTLGFLNGHHLYPIKNHCHHYSHFSSMLQLNLDYHANSILLSSFMVIGESKNRNIII